jgi:uncharacterized membrane protein YsdA (DUF1294 family)/cold shock CspA family protein
MAFQAPHRVHDARTIGLMRKRATIIRWNADKGFGFMRAADTPADVFIHVKDWCGGKQPAPGVVVEYEEIHVGGKGPRGVAVRPVGQKSSMPAGRVRRPSARQPASTSFNLQGLISIAWASWIAWCCASGRLPLWVLLALLALNIATFFAYSFDKYKARNGQWRTQEQTLHAFALLGGWPAAWLAQHRLRHKSSKAPFLELDRAMAAVNILVMLAWAYFAPPA